MPRRCFKERLGGAGGEQKTYEDKAYAICSGTQLYPGSQLLNIQQTNHIYIYFFF